jgi:transcription termination/antitermination protein NusG
MQELPVMSVGGEPQSESAPILPQQDAVPQQDTVPQSEGAAEETPLNSEPAAVETPSAGEASLPAEPAETPPKAKTAKSRKAAAEAPVVSTGPKSENMNWYILKVQSNREESIREGLLRRVAIQGLDHFFGEVIVPTEKVTEFKGGKKRVIKRKLYPGYLVVHMEINEDTWFLVRETPGIGDFTGASGVPTPMLPHEVDRIVAKQEEKSEKAPDLKIPFTKGDRVKVIEGNFENFEGEVENIDKTNGRVTVMITIFNRTTPVEFEYWQVESL